MTISLKSAFQTYLPVFLLLFFTMVIAITRLIPHPPNFSPIIAILIWSSSLNLKPKTLMQLLFGTLIISDAFLGFYSFMWIIYPIYFLLTFGIYWYLKHQKTSIKNISVLGLSSSVGFFLLSNLGVFFTSNLYPISIDGLLQCYIMALPFFQNTLASTFVFLASFYAIEFVLFKKMWAFRFTTKSQS
ncbi:MAG: hypothetical protein HAW63_03945 [Bdellovibrionaceae bacterium]|nr:hypothetical protein [Pseudobdellovibrionaceae bacterium]